MAKKRIKLLRTGRGWGRHRQGEKTICSNCPKELSFGIDEIVSRLVTSTNSHTVYYCKDCADRLNIIYV